MTKINVNGIAIRAGISRNGIKYTTEELEKFAPTLSDKPILKDHEATTDNTIGRTSRTFFNNDAVHFSGWVKEDGTGITEKIKDGRIKEVSIGAVATKLVKESEDSDHVIAKGLTAMELSTTPTPGVVGTSISQSMKEGFKLPIREEINTFIKSENAEKLANDENQTKEDSKMEQNFEAQLKEKDAQLEELQAKLSKIDEEKLATLKEEYKALCEKHSVAVQETESKDVLEALISSLKSIKPKVEEKKAETKAKVVESEQPSVEWKDYVVSTTATGLNEFFRMPSKTGELRGGN